MVYFCLVTSERYSYIATTYTHTAIIYASFIWSESDKKKQVLLLRGIPATLYLEKQ